MVIGSLSDYFICYWQASKHQLKASTDWSSVDKYNWISSVYWCYFFSPIGFIYQFHIANWLHPPPLASNIYENIRDRGSNPAGPHKWGPSKLTVFHCHELALPAQMGEPLKHNTPKSNFSGTLQYWKCLRHLKEAERNLLLQSRILWSTSTTFISVWIQTKMYVDNLPP